jgi:hypothetical protein
MSAGLERRPRTMPTVSLKERQVVLSYEDSGIPANSSDYATLFPIHPLLFDARKCSAKYLI